VARAQGGGNGSLHVARVTFDEPRTTVAVYQCDPRLSQFRADVQP